MDNSLSGRQSIEELVTQLIGNLAAHSREMKQSIADIKADVATLRQETAENTVELRTELKGDIASLRSELKENVSDLRSELKQDIASLHSEMKGEVDQMRSEMKSEFQNVNLRLDYHRDHVGKLKEELWILKKQF